MGISLVLLVGTGGRPQAAPARLLVSGDGFAPVIAGNRNAVMHVNSVVGFQEPNSHPQCLFLGEYNLVEAQSTLISGLLNFPSTQVFQFLGRHTFRIHHLSVLILNNLDKTESMDTASIVRGFNYAHVLQQIQDTHVGRLLPCELLLSGTGLSLCCVVSVDNNFFNNLFHCSIVLFLGMGGVARPCGLIIIN